jgi:hypothetical protein
LHGALQDGICTLKAVHQELPSIALLQFVEAPDRRQTADERGNVSWLMITMKEKG